MANIKIELVCPLYDGMPVTFKAPCDCTEVTGLKVCYGTTSQTFTFRDAHGNDLTGIGNLFAEGAYVKAILDITSSYAYLQNADTNKYLEEMIGGGLVSGLDFTNWASGAFSVGMKDGTTQDGTVTFDESGRPISITLNGKTLTITFPAEGEGGGDTTPELIYCMFNGTQLTAESGMTWGEWIESDYYDAATYIQVGQAGNMICPVGDVVYGASGPAWVYASDEIVAGREYYPFAGGGPGPGEGGGDVDGDGIPDDF